MKGKGTLWLAAGIGAGMVARQVWRKRGEIDSYGKVALITGGARGLGLATARTLGAEGCRIAITARDAAELETGRQDLAGRGIEALALRCDVTDCAQAEGMAGAALEHYGRIDILINNAGEVRANRLEDVALEELERAMNEMFWGTVYPTRAVLPHMLERGGGRIVNVTVAARHLLPYDCAEFAALGFTESLGRELAADGIVVSAVVAQAGMTVERAARRVVGAALRREGGIGTRGSSELAGRFRSLFPDGVASHNGNGQHGGGWMAVLSALGRTAARRYLEP